MSYDTTVRATSEVDWRMMFLQARKAVGIPDEWPFESFGFGDHNLHSVPGDFAAAVYAIPDPNRWENYGPLGPCEVQFVSDLNPNFDETVVLHELYVQELGDWLTSQGVSYAICDNRGEWVAA